MSELKKCPFCGGELVLVWHGGEDCYLCDCCGVRISLPQKESVDKAVKAYVYSRKDEIIERCVNRASTELIRKGLPKLLERMEAQT